MEEAVEEVPEYIVPWEAFRAIAEDYNLELQYRKGFREIWEVEGNTRVFGPLSERMGVRGRDGGELLVSAEEMEAASEYTMCGCCWGKKRLMMRKASITLSASTRYECLGSRLRTFRSLWLKRKDNGKRHI